MSRQALSETNGPEASGRAVLLLLGPCLGRMHLVSIASGMIQPKAK